ncbi:MAG: hypothetical protein E6Q95_05255 [Chitinophagaceae bacterium]|nr:MAG: hypothetical protein E6Q95_05255 [Chitinophagaceae bacterium]
MEKLSTDILIIGGATVMLLLVTAFILLMVISYRKREIHYKAEKKRIQDEFDSQILKSQIEVQEQTFKQISRELHDNIAQLMSTSKMLIGLVEMQLKEYTPDTLKTANATLSNALTELRSLTKVLDQDWLSKFNLLDNLKNEVNRLNQLKHITIHFNHPEIIHLKKDHQVLVFRIIQESLQNIFKHAQAKNVNLKITSYNSFIDIKIEDDGIGIPPNTDFCGLGLGNMKYRTQLLNGTIQWKPNSPKGTIVAILIPENHSYEKN